MLRRISFCLLAALLTANLLFGYRLYAREVAKVGGDDEVLRKLDVMMSVLQIIRKNYVDVDKVSSAELLDAAIDGMVSRLDPFSEYLPPADLDLLMEETTGEFGGIGVSIARRNGELSIEYINENSPSLRAGLEVNDIIKAVDDQPVTEEDVGNMLMRIRGKPGTKVKLTVLRPSTQETMHFEMTRTLISMPTVLGTQILPNTKYGYLRIAQFTDSTAQKVREALMKVLSQECEGLVVDLRSNPGGLLESAVEICGFFLPPGSLVCTTRRHSDTKENRESENLHRHLTRGDLQFPLELPMVVLVNQDSASAAEITCACLSDHNRAKLVGVKTYGKGSVQNIIELGDGSALRLTIARYYTADPKRKTIDKNGVEPDYEVPMSNEELEASFEAMRKGKTDLQLDPQLSKAVEILRNQL